MKTVQLRSKYNTGTEILEAGTHELSDDHADRAERLGAVVDSNDDSGESTVVETTETKSDSPTKNKSETPTRNK